MKRLDPDKGFNEVLFLFREGEFVSLQSNASGKDCLARATKNQDSWVSTGEHCQLTLSMRYLVGFVISVSYEADEKGKPKLHFKPHFVH